jgi:hypothetical protein
MKHGHSSRLVNIAHSQTKFDWWWWPFDSICDYLLRAVSSDQHRDAKAWRIFRIVRHQPEHSIRFARRCAILI